MGTYRGAERRRGARRRTGVRGASRWTNRVVRRAGRYGRLRRWRGLIDDAGMATAEYAIVLLAAVGFAGLLVAILKSSEVRAMLTRIVRDALTL